MFDRLNSTPEELVRPNMGPWVPTDEVLRDNTEIRMAQLRGSHSMFMALVEAVHAGRSE